jgi:hypothetical protein
MVHTGESQSFLCILSAPISNIITKTPLFQEHVLRQHKALSCSEVHIVLLEENRVLQRVTKTAFKFICSFVLICFSQLNSQERKKKKKQTFFLAA